MMTKQLLQRTAKALGKLWAGMITLPDDRRQVAAVRDSWKNYPRFPAF
jgi:hypothetical protein